MFIETGELAVPSSFASGPTPSGVEYRNWLVLNEVASHAEKHITPKGVRDDTRAGLL